MLGGEKGVRDWGCERSIGGLGAGNRIGSRPKTLRPAASTRRRRRSNVLVSGKRLWKSSEINICMQIK